MYESESRDIISATRSDAAIDRSAQCTVHSVTFALPHVTVSIMCPQSRREVSTPTQLGKGQQFFSIKVTWEMRRRVAGYDPTLIKVAYLDETLPPLVSIRPLDVRTEQNTRLTIETEGIPGAIAVTGNCYPISFSPVHEAFLTLNLL